MLRYRYTYNGEVIDDGLADSLVDLKRIHMRRMSDKEATKVRTFCRKNDLLSCQIKCEYAEEPFTEWNVLADEEEDKARSEKEYKDLIKELNRAITWVRYNRKILDFLLDSEDEVLTIPVSKPVDWENWSHFEQMQFLRRQFGGSAYVLLEPDKKMEIFERVYASTDEEGHFAAKGKIRPGMKTQFALAFYNRIKFCAHKVNLLARELGYKPVPVKKEDMPRYDEIKELKNG